MNEYSFETVYAQYQQLIFLYCLHCIKNWHDAEEVTQEILVKIWRHLDSYEPKANMSHWIARIMRNSIIDYHRSTHARRRINNTLSLDEHSILLDALSTMNDEPERQHIAQDERDERRAVLTIVLSSLNEKSRHLLLQEIHEEAIADKKALYNAHKCFTMSLHRRRMYR